jgi:hypothetical protein
VLNHNPKETAMGNYTGRSSSLLVPASVPLGRPRVVHCKRERHHVYIGRNPGRMAPSQWGNRFVVGVHGARGECVVLHENDLRERIRKDPRLWEAIEGLRGLVLGCWCAPRACHGDVLCFLANASRAEREDWLALTA